MNLTIEELEEAHLFSQICTYGKKKDVKLLIKNGKRSSNINGVDFGEKVYETGEEIYFRPLSSAVFGKNYKVVKLLLKLGADPNIIETSYQGHSKITSSPLYNAILKDDLKMIKLLMKFETDCNISEIFMNKVCERGHLEIVKFLVPKSRDENLIFCLEEAVSNDHCDIIDYFFEMFGKNSKEFNYYIEFFREAFNKACFTDKKSEIVRLFIRNIENNNIEIEKCSQNFRDLEDPDDFQSGFFEDGFFSAICGELDFDTMMLIFVKCDPNYNNEDEDNFISIAIDRLRIDILDFLLEYCDLKKIDSENLFLFLCKNMKKSGENFHSDQFEKTFRKLLNHCGPSVEIKPGKNAISYLEKNKDRLAKFIDIVNTFEN